MKRDEIIITQILSDSPQAAYATQIMQDAFTPDFGEAWSVRDLANTLAMPNVDARLALKDNAPVGFSLLYHLAGEAEILMIAVDPAHQKQGIATRLLTDMILCAQIKQHTALFLEVRDGNTAALQLYSRHHFEISGRRRGYYRGSDTILRDAITMRHILKAI
jgi:[ribosomal protein S18]-alanine N-acetyltransferase